MSDNELIENNFIKCTAQIDNKSGGYLGLETVTVKINLSTVFMILENGGVILKSQFKKEPFTVDGIEYMNLKINEK